MPCGAAVAEPIHNENWSRHDVASHLDRFVGGNAISERQYTKLKGLSRTTFQHWRHRRDNAVSQIDEADFLESAVGTKFVHRLYVALHLVLNQDGATGLRRIAKIIELTGIDTLAANSYGSQQKYAQSVEAAILDYESHERPLLVKGMSQKAITTCNDESFFGGKPCLVSIEPVSNFILLEEFTDKRDADTWEEKFDAATKDLPIKVIQSTSDEGGGILSHAKRQGAHHSPDLFHIEQELCRGVTAPLACLVQRSKKAEEEALEDLKNSPNQNDSKLKNEINKAAAKRSQYETLATSAKDIIHDISAAYHPINLKNGHHVMPSYLDHELGQKFDELTRLAKNARLSERP